MDNDIESITVPSALARVVAYEATPEFQLYLEARFEWGAAQAAYMANKCDVTFTALRIAHDRCHEALTVCRTIAEHLAAFGW